MDIIKNKMSIDVYNLKKSYPDFKLYIEEFHACENEIIGLVGNNGAGKTTFLRLILDLLLPDSGEIYSDNQSINLSDHWKEYTGSFLDEDFLIQFLTPVEFFEFIGKIYRIPRKLLEERISYLNGFIKIDLNTKKLIRDLSTGNKYKIGISSALITDPKIIVLDEPFNYLDPTSQNCLSSILRHYQKDKKGCILISSHDLMHIAELCTRILIIDNGLIIKEIKNLSSEVTTKELKDHFMI
jgi:ABC-2 type transport system ATP-binding protein